MKERYFRVIPVPSQHFEYLISKCTGTKETQTYSNNGKFVILEIMKEDDNDEIIKSFPKDNQKNTFALMSTPLWKRNNENLVP